MRWPCIGTMKNNMARRHEENPAGYILRISKAEWLKQVYDRKKYYPGILRNWRPGMTILLARKTEKEDSFIGYGMIDRVTMIDETEGEEREYCESSGWKCVLSFSTLVRFDNPVPVKKILDKGYRGKGRLLHGIRVTSQQVESVLHEG